MDEAWHAPREATWNANTASALSKRLFLAFSSQTGDLADASEPGGIRVHEVSVHPGYVLDALEFVQTIEGAPDQLLLVSSHVVSDRRSTLSVTVGGMQLTKIGEALGYDSNAGEDCDSTLWYLVNPPPGTSPVVATMTTNDRSNKYMGVWSAVLSGVDQSDPIGATDSVSEPLALDSTTLSVASAEGDLVIDSICFGMPSAAALTAGPDQELRGIISSGMVRIAGSTKPAEGTTTMSWTHDSGPHNHRAVALHPAARGL